VVFKILPELKMRREQAAPKDARLLRLVESRPFGGGQGA
jgi:hypothetical protein